MLKRLFTKDVDLVLVTNNFSGNYSEENLKYCLRTLLVDLF
jgi:hypothetical protein